jgi:hypothetical protein
MSKSCLDFSTLSDLFDDELPTIEEKENTLRHLDDCPQCNDEYGRLKKTVRFVSCLRYQDFDLCELSGKTIRRFNSGKRKKLAVRYLPAAAAVLVMLSGSYIATTYFAGTIETTISRDSGEKRVILQADGRSGISNQERIVNIVSEMKAKVLKVSDNYVEGEINYDRFKTLYRKLGHSGYHKIKFKIISGSNQSFRSLNPGSGNFAEVSSGNRKLIEGSGGKSTGERNIRFRVYP